MMTPATNLSSACLWRDRCFFRKHRCRCRKKVTVHSSKGLFYHPKFSNMAKRRPNSSSRSSVGQGGHRRRGVAKHPPCRPRAARPNFHNFLTLWLKRRMITIRLRARRSSRRKLSMIWKASTIHRCRAWKARKEADFSPLITSRIASWTHSRAPKKWCSNHRPISEAHASENKWPLCLAIRVVFHLN